MHVETCRDNRIAQLEGVGLLSFVTRPLAELQPREVRVRVRAASLNHRDLLVLKGQGPQPIAWPLVPLSDAAGEVVAIGTRVERFRPGDRVVAAMLPDWVSGPFHPRLARRLLGGSVDGVLGEYFTAPEQALLPLPEVLTFEQGATLPCAALTAWCAVFEHGDLKPGQTLLVQGSGGVSSFALQFALAAGARVIATTRCAEKVERLRALGASEVIDATHTPDWDRAVLELTGGEGVDHVVETGGARTLDQSIRAAAVGGCISLIGTLTGACGMVDTRAVLMKTLRIQGVVLGSVESFERMIHALETLAIRPIIDRVFELEQIRAALAYLESGRQVGKIVVRV